MIDLIRRCVRVSALISHEETEPRAGKQLLMIIGTINSKGGTGPQGIRALFPTPCGAVSL